MRTGALGARQTIAQARERVARRFREGGLAREAAGGKDVRLGGGVDAVRQYLEARLIDELHLAISPVLLGSGEHLFAGLDVVRLGYRCAEHVASASATHLVLRRQA